MIRQEAVDDAADIGRDEPLGVHLHVLAVLQRRDDACVGRRPADAVLFERLDEACLGEARRRLGEMLLGAQHVEVDDIALGDVRQQPVRVIVPGVVQAFLVYRHEPGFDQDRPVRAKAMPRFVRACREIHGHGVEDRRHHLARHGALPDQRVKAELILIQDALECFRRSGDRGWPDRFMGFLGILGLVLEFAHGIRNVFLAVAFGDDVANLLDGHGSQRDRVRAHVGDEADVAFAGQLDALVKFLGNAHGPLSVKAQFARRFLLQRRRRERCGGIAAALPLVDAHGGQGAAGGIEQCLFHVPCRGFILEAELLYLVAAVADEP